MMVMTSAPSPRLTTNSFEGDQQPMATDNRLEITGLTKSFGSTVVLDHVDIDVRAGEVHGLIGQNGAGKSTLVKTLAGLYPDHSGTVSVDGVRVTLKNPRKSRAEGVAVIYQEFSLVSEMTVAENLLLGREPGRVRYRERSIVDAAQQLVDRIGIDLGADVESRVGSLSPAVRQRVEILKALAADAKVLLLDEPTARLAESERHALFDVVRNLASRGVGVIFISHYLDEVRQVTDQLTILRNGRVVASQPSRSVSVNQMANLMLGERLRDVLREEQRTVSASSDNPIVLSAEALSSGERIKSVDLDLRAGEVLGVAGLVGSGRTRLCRLICGVDQPTSGILRMGSEPVRFKNPRRAIAAGVVLVPEDRQRHGLVASSPVSDNLVLMGLGRTIGRRGFVSRPGTLRVARRLINDLEVSPSNPDAMASTLSGGNQQKVVLGKAIGAEPSIFVIDQPTAGVDVGTKAQIHHLLRNRARDGAAIMVVSDDIDELCALSDRYVILRRGEIIWHGTADEISRDELVDLISSGQTWRHAAQSGTNGDGSAPPGGGPA
jgi:ribose transport system ATP-binding protein